ncbi:MAG TPA: rhamnogalacturonan acetylesterase [Edaphobacter sp.]|jgi:lysophospholipase L1-like esterase|nr:rhamnogalacturonan acetylesterase [Edaphobacter sp.]
MHLPRRVVTSSLCSVAILLSSAVFGGAQTSSVPVTPVQTSVAQDAPLNPKLPTVFIVGDSTARNQADLGWGDHFAPLFDTSRINVANRAKAGRSSRSYINEGLWEHVLSEMKPGDYVLIQMGHNDGSNPQNDPKARQSVKGIGEETVTVPITKPYTTGPLAGKSEETVHSYGWYLRKYVAEARAKGATPILLTVTIRNIWKDGPDGKSHIERDMGYRDYEYEVAAAEHVPVVDMATVEADRLEALGPQKTATLFPVDHTHTSAEGAELVAESVAEALRKDHSALAPYLKTP